MSFIHSVKIHHLYTSSWPSMSTKIIDLLSNLMINVILNLEVRLMAWSPLYFPLNRWSLSEGWLGSFLNNSMMDLYLDQRSGWVLKNFFATRRNAGGVCIEYNYIDSESIASIKSLIVSCAWISPFSISSKAMINRLS